MNMKEYIDEAEKDLLHTYNRYQIVWDKGDGVHLYDLDGREYLDFVSGIAVFALGYNNKAYNDALKAQIDKVIHTSNYYYNVHAIEAARKIKKISGMDRVFFTNSGTEAIEGAIKAARKYAYLKDGTTDHEIIAMNHSFHGRTMGALAVTGNPHYREAFEPLIGNIKFAELNDFDSVMAQVTDKTCAIIFETVQGEGGIYPATEEFMSKVKALCEEKDILLILDEIQCGMGRTGYMYAWQRYGIKPDIVSMAKGLGGGMPIGAICATAEVATAFTPGSHGTTFGGHPVSCAAAYAEVNELLDRDLAGNAKEVGAYFMDKLKNLPHVKEVRGMGLMIGVEFDDTIGAVDVKHGSFDRKLLITAIGSHVIRMVPPLIASREDCDKAYAILEETVNALSK